MRIGFFTTVSRTPLVAHTLSHHVFQSQPSTRSSRTHCRPSEMLVHGRQATAWGGGIVKWAARRGEYSVPVAHGSRTPV
jgi:hypothetical protein